MWPTLKYVGDIKTFTFQSISTTGAQNFDFYPVVV